MTGSDSVPSYNKTFPAKPYSRIGNNARWETGWRFSTGNSSLAEARKETKNPTAD